jgi:hypothetical protein
MSLCSSSINPLYNSYFRLVFGRGTDQMELMCQKVNLPGITIPDQPQPTVLGITVPIPTLSANFDPLTIEFIVDSDLNNWRNLYSWIRNITNIKDDVDHNILYQKWHHTATLYLYDPTNNCNVLETTFHYIIPIKLNGIVFQSDASDAVVQKATCMFRYSYYDMKIGGSDAVPSNLSGSI